MGFLSQVNVCTKNAICFPKLERVEFLIRAIGLAPCHKSMRKKQPCVLLRLYIRSQNPILREKLFSQHCLAQAVLDRESDGEHLYVSN